VWVWKLLSHPTEKSIDRWYFGTYHRREYLDLRESQKQEDKKYVMSFIIGSLHLMLVGWSRDGGGGCIHLWPILLQFFSAWYIGFRVNHSIHLYEEWLWTSRNGFIASIPVYLLLTERSHLRITPFEQLCA